MSGDVARGSLALLGVSHSYGDLPVLSGLNLTIQPGEFVVLVGASGIGKTTLLSLLSGYISPTAGRVVRHGVVRTIFQSDGLYPWLTVAENILMGLRGQPAAERTQQLEDLLHLIGLQAFADHYPHQLSGGMRQRVELARALAGHSDILLMDEPFSSLDYQTRLRMRGELCRILAARPRTVVFVTHDIEEAAELADRVLVLSERPARIKCELIVSAPRPRGLTDPVVVRTMERILAELGLQADMVGAEEFGESNGAAEAAAQETRV